MLLIGWAGFQLERRLVEYRGEYRVAGNLWGADVAELRTLAQQFGKTADQLLQQSTQLTSHINSTTSWKGQDAVAFRSEWNGSHRAMLQQAAFALQQESKKLLVNADQQEKASNTGAGSGGSRPGVEAGTPSSPFVPVGPEWLSNGDSPFRNGWDAYNGVLGLKGVPLGLRDISQFNARAGPGGQQVSLWQDESCQYVHVYVSTIYPGRNRAVAVEPMTGPANAFNSGDGLRWLSPGESFTISWGIDYSPGAAG
jgi:uncharacterized protein YukE